MNQTLKEYLISSAITVISAVLMYTGAQAEAGGSFRLDHAFYIGMAAVVIRATVKCLNTIIANKIKKRNSCEICYNSPTECHHENYYKPL
jgi:hypothetical protein